MMRITFNTGNVVLRKTEHSTNVYCIKHITATQLLLLIIKTDKLVQLNGYHSHDSDLAKKEVDKIVKEAIQTAATTLETPKNVLGRQITL